MKEGIKYGFGVTIGMILAIGALGVFLDVVKQKTETEEN